MNTRTNTWIGLLASCLMAVFLLAHAPAAQATPSFQAAGTPVNGTGAVTPTWPTHAVDDIALLIVESRGDEPVTLSTAAGFVEVTNSPQITGTDTRLTVFWARATSTAMASPTVADPGNHVFAQIVTYRNVTPDAGDPWDVTGGGTKTTASTSVTVTGVTTTVDNTLIVQIVSRANDANGAAFSAQANVNLTTLTERYDDGTNNGDGGGFVVWDGVKATAGATGDTTATVTSTTNAFLTIALKPVVGPAPPPGGSYGLTQCAGDRFGTNLVCTANDVQITSLAAVGSPGYCTAGDFISMTFDVTVNAGTPDRWDVGIFFSSDGKDPQPTSANGGASSCSVTVLPTTAPFLNLDPGPHSGQTDSCGDVNGSMNPTLIGGVPSANQGILRVSNVTVKCQAKSGSNGNLWVPFVLSWDNQGSPTGSLCQSAADPVPNTKSKCNAPTVAQATVVGVVVLPKIEKSDGISVIDRNQNTNYSVVITNNTGDVVTSATFKDPAVANLTVNSVSCTASGGATCPATGTNPGELSVTNMQGAGVTITNMPTGSALTFTVNATVSGSVADGTLITNTASVTSNGQTNSASDTNTVGSTALDHYELSLAASSVACSPSTVTVTACAGTGGSTPCTNIYSGASLGATLSTSAGTLASTSPTFTTGVATTTLSYTTAVNGAMATVSLASVAPTASYPTLCCQGANCTAGTSCTTTFSRNAMFVADTIGGSAANIPSQTSGVESGQFYVRAVKTLSDGSCDNALRGSATVNFGYECNNPATCYGADMMKIRTVATTTIPRNNNGSSALATTVSMTFDNNGYAPFYFTYEDVGLMTLHMQSVAAGLSGASNAFVVRPYDFRITSTSIQCSNAADCAVGNPSGVSNPMAANRDGPPFIKAGSPFVVTVRALAASLSATPSYGRENPPESVKLTPTLISPTTSNGDSFNGYNPAVANNTSFTFTNGVGTGSYFSWGEVGIITLTPSVGDGNYLAAGDVIGQTTSNVGRFIPHHFNVTRVHGCPAGAIPDTLFTYSDQPFAVTVSAVNAAGVTTRNYHGTDYAKDSTLSNAGAAGNFSVVGSNFLGANFSAGTRTQSVTYTFQTTVPAKESNPVLLALRMAENSAAYPAGDGVSSAGYTEEQTQIRSGRVRIYNANGSELLDLAVPMRVEYFNDDWIANTADVCTAVTLSTLTNYKRNLNAGETCVQDTTNPGISGQGCATAGDVAKQYRSVPSSGTYNLWLRAPGANNYGSVDLTANLLSNGVPWLRHDWNNDGTPTEDPVGTATFGTYRGNPRHIHLRELY